MVADTYYELELQVKVELQAGRRSQACGLSLMEWNHSRIRAGMSALFLRDTMPISLIATRMDEKQKAKQIILEIIRQAVVLLRTKPTCTRPSTMRICGMRRKTPTYCQLGQSYECQWDPALTNSMC
jgi:hypothetical protein